MAVADEQSPIAFDVWWEETIAPTIATGPCMTEFVRATARLAWQRGAYHAMTGNLTPPTH